MKLKIVMLKDNIHCYSDFGGGNIFREGQVMIFDHINKYFLTHDYSDRDTIYIAEYRVNGKYIELLKNICDIDIDQASIFNLKADCITVNGIIYKRVENNDQ